MFENPRRDRQARNFPTNVPKILDLKSSSEQIFSENCRWVPLICDNLCFGCLVRVSQNLKFPYCASIFIGSFPVSALHALLLQYLQRVSMEWWLLRLSAKISAPLRLSVNFFQLRLTKKLKINFFCFKKLNIN